MGLWECEKILGEAIAHFRNKVVIETKYGRDINQATGQIQGLLNNKPEHIKEVVDNMFKRLRTNGIDLLISIG